MSTQTRHDEHRASSPSATAAIYDRSSLILAIIALVSSAFASGMVFYMMLIMPSLIDAKVTAGVAETKQIANTGREHARIALSEVERANAELAAKGLIRKAEH